MRLFAHLICLKIRQESEPATQLWDIHGLCDAIVISRLTRSKRAGAFKAHPFTIFRMIKSNKRRVQAHPAMRLIGLLMRVEPVAQYWMSKRSAVYAQLVRTACFGFHQQIAARLVAACHDPIRDRLFPLIMIYHLARTVGPIASKWQIDVAALLVRLAPDARYILLFDQTLFKLHTQIASGIPIKCHDNDARRVPIQPMGNFCTWVMCNRARFKAVICTWLFTRNCQKTTRLIDDQNMLVLMNDGQRFHRRLVRWEWSCDDHGTIWVKSALFARIEGCLFIPNRTKQRIDKATGAIRA